MALRLSILPLSTTAVFLCLLSGGESIAQVGQTVDFESQIRPLLADRCFKCHGPDANQRKAGLLLANREAATAELPSGRVAIRPGRPGESELMRRITATGDERMPKQGSNLSLSSEEIELLRQWIADGAPYVPHWSLQPLRERVPN